VPASPRYRLVPLDTFINPIRLAGRRVSPTGGGTAGIRSRTDRLDEPTRRRDSGEACGHGRTRLVWARTNQPPQIRRRPVLIRRVRLRPSRQECWEKPLSSLLGLAALLAVLVLNAPQSADPETPHALQPLAAAPFGGAQNTTIELNASPIELAPGFWGTTLSARAPLFSDEYHRVHATPARTVVWPGAQAGDDYDPFTNLTWNDTNNATPALTTEVEFIQWCRSIGCHAIFEAPGEINDATIGAQVLKYTELTLGFYPDAWEIGNEPGFWVHWGQAWGNWTSRTPPPNSTQYASEVWNYSQAMRAVDPAVKIIGLPGVGRTQPGDYLPSWVSNVIKLDGPFISAIAIHVFPDLSKQNDTLDQFYSTLQKSNSQSIASRVPALERDIKNDLKQCLGCGPIPLIFTEIGSAISGRPDALRYGSQFPEAIYVAAEMTQAIDFNITNVDAYATVLPTANSWFDNSGAGRPLYELWSQVFSRLGSEAHAVNFSSGPTGLFGIASVDRADGNRSDLLIVNTNVTVAATFSPVLPIAASGYPWVVWAWNNNSTLEPTGTFLSARPTNHTIPPNSLVLFESEERRLAPLRFTEMGLPNGTRWFLGVGNATAESLNANITYYLPPGAYAVVPGPPVGYPQAVRHARWSPTAPAAVQLSTNGTNVSVPYTLQFSLSVRSYPLAAGRVSPEVSWWAANTSLNISADPAPGWVFRAWAGGGPGNYSGPDRTATLIPTGAVNETAIFVPGVLVNFTELGLPPGWIWSVEAAGQTFSGNGSSIYVLFANGTHGYRVPPVRNYYPRPASGGFTINGPGPLTIPIEFASLPTSFPVSFTETGLPLGANWSVEVRGTPFYSVNATVVAYEPNGSYSYNVTPVSGFVARPAHGGFVVAGTGFTVTISYSANATAPARFEVAFTENGLPANTLWSVAVRNLTLSSETATLTFVESNGTYLFAVGPVKNFTAHPPRGGFAVNGSSASAILIQFSQNRSIPPTYPVIWSEHGLPNGTPWSISVRHELYTSSSAFIIVGERSGNYSFNVTPVTGFVDVPGRGGFSVAAAPPGLISIAFERTYHLTFTAVGLPAGAEWEVRVGDDWASGSSATIDIVVTAGNWSFIILPPPSFSVQPAVGSIWVGNSSVSQTIVFARATPANASTQSLPGADLNGFRALIVTAFMSGAAVAMFLLLARRDTFARGDFSSGPAAAPADRRDGTFRPSPGTRTHAPSRSNDSGIRRARGSEPATREMVRVLQIESRILVATLNEHQVDLVPAEKALNEYRHSVRTGEPIRVQQSLLALRGVLWEMLSPALARSVIELRTHITAAQPSAAELAGLAHESQRLTEMIRTGDCVEVIRAYRRFRNLVRSLTRFVPSSRQPTDDSR
jgi:hypothetical protein